MGQPIAARPTPAWEYAYRRVGRHPVIAMLVATTLAALVGAVAVLAASNARIREKEHETRDAYLRECTAVRPGGDTGPRAGRVPDGTAVALPGAGCFRRSSVRGQPTTTGVGAARPVPGAIPRVGVAVSRFTPQG